MSRTNTAPAAFSIERANAQRLINHLRKAGTPKMDDKTFFADLQAARANPIVLEQLRRYNQLGLLNPSFDATHLVDATSQVKHTRWYMTPAGVVREEELDERNADGSLYKRSLYLNGQLHDVDGKAAVQTHRSATSRPASETIQHWQHGVQLAVNDDDADLSADGIVMAFGRTYAN
jgi:hypothetical protein